MGNLLQIQNLVKRYVNATEELTVLRGVNFSMEPGETAAITGESGSGKSTFLNMIGGLDPASEGSIIFDGTELTTLDEDEMTIFRNRRIGYIFQAHYLLEEFTALENVMIPALMHDFNRKRASEQARSILSSVGMNHRETHYPSQLSGGEKQRIAIARSFVNSPELILADEPTGNLDEKNAAKVLDLLFTITTERNHALILVTHSNQIAAMTGRQYHLESGTLIRRDK
jgi:lipoprotein-releasing system ATP-binding protein